MHKLIAPLLFFSTCTSAFAADNGFGFGVDGVGKSPAADRAPVIRVLDHEPWMTDAHIGDFIVIRYGNGRICRREVTALGDDTLTVTETNKEETSETMYRRTPKLAPDEEATVSAQSPVELHERSTGTITLHGHSIARSISNGYMRSLVIGTKINGVSARYEVWSAIIRHTSPNVPFGGVIKSFSAIAHREYETFDLSKLKPGEVLRRNNPNKPTVLDFEVIDFGFGPAVGK